jgi:hypothetical protein
VQPVDILITSATTDGAIGGTVTYEIQGGSVAPFEIGWHRSSDAVYGSVDEFLATVLIDAAEDLASGVHTKTFVIGTDPGSVALPGIGVLETDTDYHLLVVADRQGTIPEHDSNSPSARFRPRHWPTARYRAPLSTTPASQPYWRSPATYPAAGLRAETLAS